MFIKSLIKNNQGLPDHNYYLDVSDFLINEANQIIKEDSTRKLPKKIEEIKGFLALALDLFQEEKNNLNEIQIRGFIIKKNIIKTRLELVQNFQKN